MFEQLCGDGNHFAEIRAQYCFRGRVDLARLHVPDAPLGVQWAGDFGRIQLPGLDIQWRAGHADVAAGHGLLVLSTGRARRVAAGRDVGQSRRWLDDFVRDGSVSPETASGGFAVAVLDSRAKKAVLFVDRFSIETLCYRMSDGVLGIADSARALPGKHGPLDPQALFDYLYFHVIPSPRTVFLNARRMQAAELVTVTATTIDESLYWSPTFVEHERHDLQGRLRVFVAILKDGVAEEADDPATAS